MYFDIALTSLSLPPSNTGEQQMTIAIVQEAIEQSNCSVSSAAA